MKQDLRALAVALVLAVLSASAQAGASPKDEIHKVRLAPDRAFMGFSMALETLEDGSQGIRVMRLVEGGPAEKVGLEVGDLILTIDQEPIPFANSVDMIRGLDRYKAGQPLDLEVRRGGSTVHKTLLAGETSPTDRKQLEAWLANAEAVLGGSSTNPDASCLEPRDEEAEAAYRSAERWQELIRRIAQINGQAEFTVVRRNAGAAPEVVFTTGSFRDVGLTFADLPETMKDSLSQLKPGDSTRYRISASEKQFTIDELSP